MSPEIRKENFNIFESNLREIGFTYFSYGLVAQGEVLLSYFTHQEWGHLYQKNHYSKIDPLLQGVVYSHFPLIVWDALRPSGEEKKVMVERNEICALKSGLTFGISHKKNIEIIALGSEMSPREFHCSFRDENYTRKVNQMISHFYKSHKENFPIQYKLSSSSEHQTV